MLSATFLCLRSGHTVTFTTQVDIDSMKFHPDYVAVVTAPVAPVVTEEAPKKTVGRPKKTESNNSEGE